MSRSRRRPPPSLIQLGRDLRPTNDVSMAEFNDGTGPQGIICMRVSDGPPAVPSKRGTCDTCLAQIWLSPSTMQLLPHVRAPELLCLQCFAEHLRQEEGGKAGP